MIVSLLGQPSLGNGHGDREGAAKSKPGRRGGDAAMLRFGQQLGQVKPESHSAHRRGFANTAEALEDMPEMPSGDADAFVRHRDGDAVAGDGRAGGDAT